MCRYHKQMLFQTYKTPETNIYHNNIETDQYIIMRICIAGFIHLTILGLMIKTIQALYE